MCVSLHMSSIFLTRQDEIKKAIENIGGEVKDTDIERLLQLVDHNKDGQVNFAEFKLLVEKLLPDPVDVEAERKKAEVAEAEKKKKAAEKKAADDKKATEEKKVPDDANAGTKPAQDKKASSPEAQKTSGTEHSDSSTSGGNAPPGSSA